MKTIFPFLSVSVLALFITVCAGIGETEAAAEGEKPNVLFIAVDDLNDWIGVMGGHPQAKTPHMDRLASRGVLFSNAHCQSPVCNPSRASLLTGMRPETLRIWDLPKHFRQRVPNVVTLPQLFKQSGYFTYNVGKIFHNWRQDKYRGDAASWSYPESMHYNTHGADKPIVEGAEKQAYASPEY